MKSIIKYLIPAVMMGIALTSCEKDEDNGKNEDIGNPKVLYIRTTDPVTADSLLVGAFMGNLIAIVGKDLGHTVELWFNDQRAQLNPTFVTDKSIIVNVPSSVPLEITDKIRFVFSNGEEMLYDFKVNVPAPEIGSIKCEYVPDGGTVVLYGDFFFEPVKVIFPGDLEGEVVSVEKLKLEVTVPAGTQPGNLVVETNFGNVKSDFIFRDTRGVFWNFDDLIGGGWRPGANVSGEGGVSGNYAILSGLLEDTWQWKDDNLEIDLWGQSAGRPPGPLFTGNPDDMLFKFEVNVVKEWTGAYMNIIFSPWDNAGNAVNTNNTFAKGQWIPWQKDGAYKTDGWVTVSMPLSEFVYSHDRSINNLKLDYPNGCGSLSVFVWGPVPNPPNDIEIRVDNFRVVPK
jgi:hypothetical protein